MRNNLKKILGAVTATALLATTVCGLNLINLSAETTEKKNYVPNDINNFTEFTNPDKGTNPNDLSAELQTISGGVGKVWNSWHNKNGGSWTIEADSDIKYGNFKTLKYTGASVDAAAMTYFFVKLEPGTYNFSFYVKGENLKSAKVGFSAKQGAFDECKDLKFSVGSESSADVGKFNNLEPTADIMKKTKTLSDGNLDWTRISENFTVSGSGTQAVRFWLDPAGSADGMWLGDFSVTSAEAEEDNEPTDPDELISKDVNKVKYFYNPDKGGDSTADPSKTNMKGKEALNRNWFMWMREANNGNDISVVDEGHNGNPAIKLTGSENTALYGTGLAYFTLKLDPGTYELKYWAKCKDIYGNENQNVVCSAEIYSVDAGELDKQWPVSVRLKKKTEISVFDSVPYYLEGTKYSEDWTQKTRTIKVTGDEAQLVDINFNTNNVAGEVWISDFSLKLKTSGGSSGDSGTLEDPEDPYYPTDSDDEPYYPDDSEITEDSDLETISKTGETSFIETAFILFVISAGFIAFEVTRRAKKANANGRH